MNKRLGASANPAKALDMPPEPQSPKAGTLRRPSESQRPGVSSAQLPPRARAQRLSGIERRPAWRAGRPVSYCGRAGGPARNSGVSHSASASGTGEYLELERTSGLRVCRGDTPRHEAAGAPPHGASADCAAP